MVLPRYAAAAVPGVLSSANADAESSPAYGDAIVPFRVSVPAAAVADLKDRLRSTRLPDRGTTEGWTQGVPIESARRLIDRWSYGYDWYDFERRLNALPQFRTTIDGVGIHFIHVRSRHVDALPIILTHGWPGSIVEFMKVVGPLTDPTAHGGRPEDAFHVVVPSMPGFGWSDKPRTTGWNVDRTARAWGVLMKRLGYRRWVAQGGDWGSGVTHALGRERPEGLVAAHVNWPFVFPATPPEQPTDEEKAAFAAAGRFVADQSGYYRQQATRPQTIAYGLADSPIGQATWIYEKFQAWTDNGGSAEDALSLDEMLDNISLYWFTDTAASSARIYWENATHTYDAGRIELPMAATVFPHEIFRAPRKWAEQHWPNLFYWNEVDRGGHFAAFEQPQLFTQEMRRAFGSVRVST
ncbi:epoxide hydrolase family protein [Sphingomonas sp. DT-51]|uniref:epoxide hydrolase family protein n=1 Tax=Sphingomonas sp. DT-51 TaxID=3396165 RepID=UPI003F19F719